MRVKAVLPFGEALDVQYSGRIYLYLYLYLSIPYYVIDYLICSKSKPLTSFVKLSTSRVSQPNFDAFISIYQERATSYQEA